MAQYIKHYWKDTSGQWIPINKEGLDRKYPEVEYPGLDVEVWAIDKTLIDGKTFGVDVCLSIVPDSTPVADITETFNINGVNVQKKVVQVITESDFNLVKTPYDQISPLFMEADILLRESWGLSGDDKIAKEVESLNKKDEAEDKQIEVNNLSTAL